jgi:hypothetical protein
MRSPRALRERILFRGPSHQSTDHTAAGRRMKEGPGIPCAIRISLVCRVCAEVTRPVSLSGVRLPSEVTGQADGSRSGRGVRMSAIGAYQYRSYGRPRTGSGVIEAGAERRNDPKSAEHQHRSPTAGQKYRRVGRQSDRGAMHCPRYYAQLFVDVVRRRTWIKA